MTTTEDNNQIEAEEKSTLQIQPAEELLPKPEPEQDNSWGLFEEEAAPQIAIVPPNGESSETISITLPAFLDIAAAQDFHKALLENVASAHTMILDCSEVARMTTPAVQLLISTSKTAESAGKSVVILNPSNVMEQSFRELGVESTLKTLRH